MTDFCNFAHNSKKDDFNRRSVGTYCKDDFKCWARGTYCKDDVNIRSGFTQ